MVNGEWCRSLASLKQFYCGCLIGIDQDSISHIQIVIAKGADLLDDSIQIVIAKLHMGSPKSPAFWGEEEPPHEVKAYQPDMPTEYGE